MRPTSYASLFFIIALLAVSYVTAPAQVSAAAAQAPSAVVASLSSLAAQRPADNLLTVHQDLQNPASAPAANSQAKKTESAEPQDRIEAASILPDAGSLLPVAAVVGFSFLVGGIVCGAWKTRP
ncbi:MAG: hypothetical protein WAM71_01745 [Candidatus Korobacteraceae bacterium]